MATVEAESLHNKANAKSREGYTSTLPIIPSTVGSILTTLNQGTITKQLWVKKEDTTTLKQPRIKVNITPLIFNEWLSSVVWRLAKRPQFHGVDPTERLFQPTVLRKQDFFPRASLWTICLPSSVDSAYTNTSDSIHNRLLHLINSMIMQSVLIRTAEHRAEI